MCHFRSLLLSIACAFLISACEINANWLLQRNPQSTCRTRKNEITCKSPPFVEDEKALWNDPFVGEGKAYWKLTFEYADTYEVGVTDRPDFRRKNYRQNLSTSIQRSLMNQNGTNPNVDLIGVLCISTSKKLQVYFDVNGSTPELMYEIPRKMLKEKLFPVTSFQAKRVAIIKSNDFPVVPNASLK